MSATDQFTEDGSLTAISISYTNPDETMIADEVLPRANMSGRSYKWHEFDVAQNFTIPDTHVGRRGTPRQVEIEGTEKDGSVEGYAIDVPLDNVTIQEAERNGFNPRTQATEYATSIIMLDRELRVSNLITDADNYLAAQKLTLAGTDMFDHEDCDPLTILEDMLSTCLQRPNQITFGPRPWAAIRKNARIMKAIHGNLGDEGRATRNQIAELLEVERIIVGASRINIKRPGEAAVLANTWGNSVSAQYVNRAAASSGGLTFGFTAQFGNKKAGTLNADMGTAGGILVRASEEVKEHIVAPAAGFLLSNVTAAS